MVFHTGCKSVPTILRSEVSFLPAPAGGGADWCQVHQLLGGCSLCQPCTPDSIHLTTSPSLHQAVGIAQGARWVHPGPGAKAGQGAMLLPHQRVKGYPRTR